MYAFNLSSIHSFYKQIFTRNSQRAPKKSQNQAVTNAYSVSQWVFCTFFLFSLWYRFHSIPYPFVIHFEHNFISKCNFHQKQFFYCPTMNQSNPKLFLLLAVHCNVIRSTVAFQFKVNSNNEMRCPLRISLHAQHRHECNETFVQMDLHSQFRCIISLITIVIS